MPRLRRKTIPSTPERRVSDPAAWREMLMEEEQRCAAAGFGAGLVSIDFGGSEHPSEARADEILRLVDTSIAWTDRYCLVAPGVVSVLAVPLTEIHQLERLARRLDSLCRQAGIHTAIGWSHRRDSSDLIAAWARADANAAVAHARHVRLVG